MTSDSHGMPTPAKKVCNSPDCNTMVEANVGWCESCKEPFKDRPPLQVPTMSILRVDGVHLGGWDKEPLQDKMQVFFMGYTEKTEIYEGEATDFSVSPDLDEDDKPIVLCRIQILLPNDLVTKIERGVFGDTHSVHGGTKKNLIGTSDYFLIVTPKPHQATERVAAQVDRLAKFIGEEIPGEPSESQGAVDTAIRWMRQQLEENKDTLMGSVEEVIAARKEIYDKVTTSNFSEQYVQNMLELAVRHWEDD